MEEVGRHDEAQLGQDNISNGISRSIGSCNNTSSSSSSDRCSGTNHGPHHHIDLINPTLKSNLKKTSTTTTTTVEDQDKNQFKTERRKVSWPDAHGKDIAQVQEFEPSVSDDGELEGVRNSCVCAIQ